MYIFSNDKYGLYIIRCLYICGKNPNIGDIANNTFINNINKGL